MKKFVFMMLFFPLVFAQISYGENIKIGIVDLQYALYNCEAGKEANSKLQKEAKTWKETLNKKKEAIHKLEKQIEKQRLMLTQEAQLDKELEYKQKVQEFKTLYNTFQKKMQIKERQLMEPIFNKLVKVIEEYGKQKKFTLILEKRSSGVIYNDDAIDITREVIVKFNQAWRNRKKKK